MMLRLYLGELDDPYIEVPITQAQWNVLLQTGKASIDDGGIKFTELFLTYHPETKSDD